MAKDIFHLEASDLVEGLLNLENKSELAMMMYAQNAALKLQNSARANAPWTDRTGHARQRLTCTAERVDTGYKLTLAHGVDYGIWLELANEKRYATIDPSIQREGPNIVSGFENLISKL